MSIIHRQTSSFHSGHFGDEESLLQQFSRCPSCRGLFRLALILPCSHPMCSTCVTAAAEVKGRSQTGSKPGLNSCTVLCPCCRRPVELPCRTWASAVSCLPEYPNVNSGCTAEVREEASARREQKEVYNRHRSNFTIWGLHFALDPSHIPSSINLSKSFMSATYKSKNQPQTAICDPCVLPMALLNGDALIRQGQYYWEVDVCNSALYRIGVRSWDSSRAWWFERRGFHFSAVYDGTVERVYSVPPGIKTIGLFLNINGGALSFYSALSQEHLLTLPTRFDSGGVVPAFALGQGTLKIRTGLSPNPLVFHSKDSGYRGAQGTARGTWRRSVAFGSVKKVVEKFEELALSQ